MKARLYRALHDELRRRRPVALVTVLSGPAPGAQLLLGPDGPLEGGLGDEAVDARASELAGGVLASREGRRQAVEHGGRRWELFVESFAPPARLIVVGAVHIAVPLVRLAKTLGYRTIVVDPRASFATRERFPDADELRVEWPREALEAVGLDAASCVAALSHDLKIDVPALAAALRSPARYVGALGSRATQAKRSRALLEAGLTEEQIGRIRSPIGLDLGGRSPEEIAVSIVAELVATAHGREGR